MKKLFFVHIPKTAGNSVRQALRQQDLLTNPGYDKKEREHHFAKKNAKRIVGQHLSFKTPNFPSYVNKKEYINSYLSFSIVRNPYDLLVSYYSHYIDKSKTKNWIDNGWANVNGYHGFKSFDEFINFYCKCEPEEWHIPSLNRNLYCQIFDEDNKSKVDYVVFYDKLEINLNKFLNDVVGVKKKIVLPKKNVSHRRKTNNFYSYYSEKNKKLVQKKVEKQFKVFDFNTKKPFMETKNLIF